MPAGSLDYWGGAPRAVRRADHGAIETRFGDTVLPLVDPHGLQLALVESARSARARAFTPWDGSPVPAERQVRGLYGAQIWEREAAPTRGVPDLSRSASNALGDENGWTRYGFADAAGVVDIRETPDERRGAWGVGSVHHLAWRVRRRGAPAARCARRSRRPAAMRPT